MIRVVMDGVLTRSPTHRPRGSAVGPVLALCLVGSPLMSLFPLGVWEAARALALSGAVQWVLLFAPVIVGVILLMMWLSALWLEGAGARHPTSTAALVTGTAMTTPVVVGYLAPAFTPFPGGLAVNVALLTAAITTVALGACALVDRLPYPWPPGPLPGLVVVVAALVSLPPASEVMRAWAAEERSRDQITDFAHTIAVLDHPDWSVAHVHEVSDALRLTYRHADGATVHVHSWGGSTALGPHGDGVRAGCDLPGVSCYETDGSVLVDRGPDIPDELRVRLGDGTVVSLTSPPDSPADVARLAPSVRPEAPGERDVLVESVTTDPAA
ncbi:hypothetical protein AB0I72_12340 [Nocardiopsis sp. NPDC049922]|uniref:hypothetical protein n=1 Tax=Nocardiopsis sp. NPDC049922 TaxID=3155157 RepID=UPI0033D438E6